MMKILKINKRFEGINPTPNPKPNPDTSYTVKLTITQWTVFQENMKKPANLAPLERPNTGRAPANQPKDNISVQREPSTLSGHLSLPLSIFLVYPSFSLFFTEVQPSILF